MDQRICSVDGCDKKRHVAAGYCGMHHYRVKKYGTANPELARQPRQGMVCAIDDCDRERYSGKHGWCKKHYGRWLRHDDPMHVAVDMPDYSARADRVGECEIADCGGRIHARRMCKLHYGRWRIGRPISKLPKKSCREHGCRKKPSKYSKIQKCRAHDPDWLKPKLDKRCSVDECMRPHHAYGYCSVHAARHKRYGDPSVVRDVPRRSDHHKWLDVPTYAAVHFRLKAERGPASQRRCVDCGDRAAHWSYGYGSQDEQVDDRSMAFSSDLSYYHPRCVRCHKAYDMSHS